MIDQCVNMSVNNFHNAGKGEGGGSKGGKGQGGNNDF